MTGVNGSQLSQDSLLAVPWRAALGGANVTVFFLDCVQFNETLLSENGAIVNGIGSVDITPSAWRFVDPNPNGVGGQTQVYTNSGTCFEYNNAGCNIACKCAAWRFHTAAHAQC